MEELLLLRAIADNPSITQKELAQKLGKSERTIKARILMLQEKNNLRRVNGKRYGKWEIMVDISAENDD